MSFTDFLSSNASALFALAGALVGAFASFISTWILSHRELRLKLREKILDRRIEAHEKIIDLSHSLRTMVALGGLDTEGELARAPSILSSQEAFDAWFLYFYDTMSSTSNWLRNDLVREINLLQDYVVNLNEFLRDVPTENYIRVGQLIRLDFIHFSESIEKLAFKFFSEDLEKLRIGDIKLWHKYPIEETERRLQQTELFCKRVEMTALAGHS